MHALRGCPPAFAAQLVRAMVLSQARFTYRNPPWHPRTPRRTFGNGDLALLEHPWPNATTGELLARMEWHAGLAGNAFVAYRGKRLRVLRPDWTAILYGSDLEPDNPGHALDGVLLGYLYVNGGFANGWGYEPQLLVPADCAHWSPIPDPENAGVGMSWLTPAVRDIQGDRMASEYKIRFWEQGATPNLVIKGLVAPDREKFDALVDMLEERHAGAANAFRTLYLTAGADATVIGSNLQEMDMKAITGSGETRISVLSRVPASLLGISEGLAGSTLNAGNFSSARRSFADTWVYPTLQDVAASLAPLVNVPADAELWFDVADIPLLREDAKDAAEIEGMKATTIRQLVDGGFEPTSVIAAVQGQNMALLRHSGLLSVQLQEPGAPALTSSPSAGV
jgi:phage portal protein BeeE